MNNSEAQNIETNEEDLQNPLLPKIEEENKSPP